MIFPIIYAGLGIAFFTSLILITRRPLSLADKVVIAFLLFLSLPMIFKVFSHILPPGSVVYLGYSRLLPLGFGPCLYLYALIMTDEMKMFESKYMVHFMPFVLTLVLLVLISDYNNPPKVHIEETGLSNKLNRDVINDKRMGKDRSGGNPFGNLRADSIFNNPPPGRPIPGSGVPGGEWRLNFKKEQPDFLQKRHPAESIIIRGGIVLSFISYTIALLILVRRHYRKISEYFSYDSIMINLGWLKWITLCFFLSYGFVIAVSFLPPGYILNPVFNPFFTPDLSTVFFIIIFSLFAIKQPVIFKEVRHISEEGSGQVLNLTVRNERKYEKSGLKEDDAENYLKILEDYMTSEKPYLDPDLTIFALSEKLNIPKHYMTEIINKKYDRNFYMFVNSYRIEEAKNRLQDETFQDHSIIRIAYDCGFNSKSTFNNVFKKFTELTPTDYRMKRIKSE